MKKTILLTICAVSLAIMCAITLVFAYQKYTHYRYIKAEEARAARLTPIRRN